MPTVEERISSLEAKVDAIADLPRIMGELRRDMNRLFDDLRTDMNRRFDEVDRRFDEVSRRFERVDQRFEQVDQRFEQVDDRNGGLVRRLEILDQRMERHFMWMVGIQFTVLLAVIVALIQMSPR
jgi:chromosome segregation ATPase